VALWATTVGYAAGPGFSAVLGGSGQDYAAAVASDAQGNTYVAGLTYSPDFPVTAGAFQSKLAGNGSLANPYAIASDAFVAKFAPNGTLLWSTFLGGSADDYATGVGVDAAGNVLVCGWTRSFDFPVSNAIQGKFNGGASPYRWDAFVTKLDPTGSKLIYSTFLGGPDDDGAYGLAVDASGNAYVTGPVGDAAGFTGFSSSATGFGVFVTKLNPQGALVYSFFHPHGSFAGIAAASAIAVDSTGAAYVAGSASPYYPVSTTQTFGPPGNLEALVFKLSPDGSRRIYEVTLGGSGDAEGMAIAVDHSGAAYVAGITTSVDFPLLRPLQSNMGARPLWKSTDSGFTWKPLDNLPFAFLQALVVDPTSPSTLYAAATDAGVFKSLDGGVTWNQASQGIASGSPQVLTIDPLHPQTLYAATGSGVNPGVVYKTVNGGSNWSVIDSSASAQAVQVLVDAQNPSIVYTQWDSGTRKSTDGGITWSNVAFPGTSTDYLALDPRASGHLFAFSAATPGPGRFGTGGIPAMVWRGTDGGNTWMVIPGLAPLSSALTVDSSTNPSTVYDGFSERSVDGGITWSALGPSVASGSAGGVAVDPNGTLYAAPYNNDMFTSHDRGLTWTAIGSPVPPSANYGAMPSVLDTVPVAATATLYAVVNNPQSTGFVAKLSPDGASLVFSTFLHGHPSMEPVNTFAAEPGVLMTQNWISGIALDPAGNAVVAGGTRSTDFPTANPAQANNAGQADAFVATISADGGTLNYATYMGGSADDSALAVTIGGQGNVIFAGQTWSRDFPAPGGAGVPSGYGKAFVVKLAPPAPPAITAVLNAASFQPGIEAGSWVMIRGTGLANTNPGRTWTAGEVAGGNLPTSLDGVSVTIDGKPAFVEYISPAQINVQAPSDTVTGPVGVVVDNNGAVSVPATAQLQPAAPAFFLYPGTNYAVASRLPDYAPVADPSAVPGTVAAQPGDLIVLWGTGFGATNPAQVAGTTVIGAPAVETAPTVTAGGLAVPVVSAVLTAGAAGLYQITVRLPGTVPTGAVAVQASADGVSTQAGVDIFVGKP
jgi:uncharacterized protein (TIGR03437 family)